MMSFLNTNRMDDLSQRENRYLSLSNRLASSKTAHHRIPSQEDVHNDIDSFDNEIPDGRQKAGKKRLTRLTQHQFDGASGGFENEIPDDQQEPDITLFTGAGQRELDTASGSSGTSLRGRSRLNAVIWPAMIITLPIAWL